VGDNTVTKLAPRPAIEEVPIGLRCKTPVRSLLEKVTIEFN